MSQIKSLGDIRARLRENWTGYWQEFRMLLVLVVLASLADTGSTIYFMLSRGPGAEGHPVIRLISHTYGPVLGPILGKVGQFLFLIVVTVFLRRWALLIFVPVIILYGWAAWYNIWGYELYHPRLVRWMEHLAG
jgi:hypothetical protein